MSYHADRWWRRRCRRLVEDAVDGGEVGDDTLAMLEAHDEAFWRSYLAHPASQGWARLRVLRTVRPPGDR